MTRRAASILFALAMAAFAGPAAAHEYWLSPSHYRGARGDVIDIAAFAGTGFRGESKPFASTRSVRFEMVGPRTRDLTPAASNGDLVWARFEIPDGGGVLVSYQSNFAKIELPATEFDMYLETEGLAAPRAARARLGATAGPGRERYARCPKTWIAAASPGTGVAVAGGPAMERLTHAVGLPIEIVPLADPGVVSTLPVRVLWHGRPLAGALVRAWNRPLENRGAWAPFDPQVRDSVGFVAKGVTNTKGEVRLPIATPGEWMIATVHMVPCGERGEADWESWWASLTFARAGQ